MPEDGMAPDLVELTSLAFEAANRRDLEGVVSFFAADTVFEGRGTGDTFEGRAAFRSFLDGWFGAYEELEFNPEEVRDLGGGVVFAVVFQEAVPASSAAHVSQREGWILVWERGLIARLATLYTDIDEGRAAATALAESRRNAGPA